MVQVTLIVSPTASVTGVMVVSAIIREPATVDDAVPLDSAKPLIVKGPELWFVKTGATSENWQVPDEGAIPSFITVQTVALVVCTKLLLASIVPVVVLN